MGDTPDPAGTLQRSAAVGGLVVVEAPTRGRIVRELALFQLKLLLDGLKDVLLSPLSLLVALLSLLAPTRATGLWRSLYRLGQRLDAWLDLFPEVDDSLDATRRDPTIDSALSRTEELIAALRQGGVRAPQVQAQLAAVLRSIEAITSKPGDGAATATATGARPHPEGG